MAKERGVAAQGGGGGPFLASERDGAGAATKRSG